MFKIGDFSNLSRVSVKTLRYYDEIGLLRPVEIDRFTGYRYYAASQLSRLNRILLLKGLGLSLDQIGRLLESDLPPDQLRGMLKLRRAEIERSIEEEEVRLAQVAALLNQIEQENSSMSNYDVVIKKIAPVRIASIRAVVANYGAQGELWGELGVYLEEHKVKAVAPCLTIDHNEGYKERDVDLEVCEVVDAALSPTALPGSDRVRVYELPAVDTMACTVHHGPFPQLNQGYQALMQWVEANGYRFTGSSREVYLHVDGDEASNVAEIQIPVEKSVISLAAPSLDHRVKGHRLVEVVMLKLDLKKQFKHLYQPSARQFSIVDAPPVNFLMIDGTGDPNTSADFQAALEALYALCYTLKFGVKQGKYGDTPCDYPVMPLEGLWWTDDLAQFSAAARDEWHWTVMIMQPDIITAEMVAAACADVAKKKNPVALSKVRFEKYHEGPGAQIMYTGPFKDEGPTIARLHEFIRSGGHQLRGKHHEIYLSDFRRTAPEKLKTVIRQPLQ